jgi:hypothetical protein
MPYHVVLRFWNTVAKLVLYGQARGWPFGANPQLTMHSPPRGDVGPGWLGVRRAIITYQRKLRC